MFQCVRARDKLFDIIEDCIKNKKSAQDQDTETNLFSLLINPQVFENFYGHFDKFLFF